MQDYGQNCDDDDDNYEDVDSSEENDEEDENENGYYIEDSNENNKKDFKITLTCGIPPSLKNKINSRVSNDEYGSDDEKTFMKENYDSSVGLPLTTSCQSLVSNASNVSASRKKNPKKKKNPSLSARKCLHASWSG